MVNGLEGDNLKKCMFTMWSRKTFSIPVNFLFYLKSFNSCQEKKRYTLKSF